MGIIPKILEHLLRARDTAKEEMESATTAFMKDVFNGKQLAFKISCNSVYGFTGCVDTGMLPCKPIAEVTTTIGRGMIEKSKNFSENPDNLKEVIGCTEYFPLDYCYLSQW
jgi:DNA polymerase delta subunit 1